jgi:hypothetical protein
MVAEILFGTAWLSRAVMERSTLARLVVLALVLTAVPVAAGAASLRGSKASLREQRGVAAKHDYTYLRDSSHLKRFVSAGLLVKVPGNANYELHRVSYPYARPETELFVNRLSAQYRAACGEKLVVTSLTRPLSSQPWNASGKSVHPTGMAIDLRRSNRRSCQAWIERILLTLETEGVLEATKEQRPPHYHVAVFPREYTAYVSRLIDGGGERKWMVRSGDTLWSIARESGVRVSEIREINEISDNQIFKGQLLQLPTR